MSEKFLIPAAATCLASIADEDPLNPRNALDQAQFIKDDNGVVKIVVSNGKCAMVVSQGKDLGAERRYPDVQSVIPPKEKATFKITLSVEQLAKVLNSAMFIGGEKIVLRFTKPDECVRFDIAADGFQDGFCYGAIMPIVNTPDDS